MAITETVRGPSPCPRCVYILATSEHGAEGALETLRPLASQDVERAVLVPHTMP